MERFERKDIEDILSLTSMQEGMLFHYLKNPGSGYYFEQLSLEISGEIEYKLFEDTWKVVIAANEMLRTVFRWEKLEKPSQIILKEHPCEIRFHDLSGIDTHRREAALEEIKTKDRGEGFDLTRVPFRIILCKLDGIHYEMIISNHHILYDGWSNGIILKEFFRAYQELFHGKQEINRPTKTPFKEFIKWHQNRDRNKQVHFWKDYLAGFETPKELPIKRKIEETTDSADYSIILEQDIKGKLDVFVKNNRVTMASVFYTAWGILLQKYCDREDVIFGTPVSGRSGGIKGIEDMVGLFINTVPLRIQSIPGIQVIDIVSSVENLLQVREAFESTPLPDIRSYSTVDGSGSLFDTIVVIENYPLDNRLLPENSLLSINLYSMFEITHYDLSIGIMPFNEIELKFTYNRGFFDKESIENLAGHFKGIILNMINTPEMKLSQLDIISTEEKNRILYDYNNTAAAYPRDKTIHQLFEEQASKTPDHIAIVGAGSQTCPITLTYNELNEQSNRLAGLLIEKSVLPDNIVGIISERSIEMIIGIFGILKSGGAYLPIDPELPQERIDYMLKDSGAKLLVADKHKEGEKVLRWEGRKVFLEEIFKSPKISSYPHNFLPSYLLNPSNLAYVIYTSGSTGKPKGVMIENRSVINFIKGITDIIPFQESDRILSLTTISFDIFGLETILPLTKGSAVIIGSVEEQQDAGLGALVVEREAVTIFQGTPSRLQLFVQIPRPGRILKKLKYLLVGGEVFPEALLVKLKQLTDASIYNVYGPTETTIWSTIKEVSGINELNIGKPLANTSIYILSQRRFIQPVGVPGEIYISGEGVARGYINRPELSAEKFEQDSWDNMDDQDKNGTHQVNFHHSSFIIHYSKLYRTGDLGRWLSDGNIECLGRIDQQVKIRGFRIELGEIEKRLLSHEKIKEAVVLAKVQESGDKYLCAYIVFHSTTNSSPDPSSSSVPLTISQLRAFLSQDLPNYMIPASFIILERIPVTSNGKVDRKALANLEENDLRSEVEYVAPRNSLEEKLSKIWGNILGKKVIGINENFFELGGNSLVALRLTAKINKELDVNVPITKIFDYNTIAILGEFITKNGSLAQEVQYPEIVPDVVNLYQPFPLTQIQLAYLVGRKKIFELGAVSTHAYTEVETYFNILRLNAAFNKVIKRHPMLRTIFIDEQQQVLPDMPVYEIQVEDLSDAPGEVRQERLLKERLRMSHFIFEPERWPLFEIKAFKLSENIHYLCIGIDMLICDGVSFEILVRDLLAYYENPEEELPALVFSFRDYVLALEKMRNSWFYKRAKEYWLNKLFDFPSAPALPLKCNPGDIATPRFNRCYHQFSQGYWGQLEVQLKTHSITKSSFLATVYAEVLAYWSNQPQLAFNLTVFNRYPFHEDVSHLVGDFSSVILVGLELKPEDSFWERAKTVQRVILNALEHRHYDGVEFIRELNRYHKATHKALMPIVFTSLLFDNQDMDMAFLDRIGERKMSISQTTQVYLDFQASEQSKTLAISWDYVEDLFEDDVIHGMFEHYITRLDDILKEKEDNGLVPQNELQRIIQQYNQYNHCDDDFPGAILHQMFSDQVSRTPHHSAVEFGSTFITYKKLDEQSNQLAYYLKEKGVKPNLLVGILSHRGIEIILDVLGILKAGGAYIPIDPDYPQERQDYIYSSSNCQYLVTPSLYQRENLAEYPIAALANVNSKEDLAYVIYTSGSTGRPKGVMETHGKSSNTIIDISRKFQVNEHDRIMAISSMSFDLSVYDVFGSLSTGAILVLISSQKDVKELVGTLYQKKITIWNSVPAIMDMSVAYLESYLKPESPVSTMDSYTRERIRARLLEKVAEKKNTLDQNEKKYYWSPICSWKINGDQLSINNYNFPRAIPEVFPELYFLAQDGVTVNAILQVFPRLDPYLLKQFIYRLIEKRVLVDSLLSPEEIFQSQVKLFANPYTEEMLYNENLYNEFKKYQLSRFFEGNSFQKIELENPGTFPAVITGRRSYREFNTSPIPFPIFSLLLSTFKQIPGNEIRYFYASAGGLYPIDIFIYVKEGRVENMKQGLYYYNPMDNCLQLVNDGSTVNEKIHFKGNKEIFRASAISLFMIYDAGVTMPKYGGNGYFYACIDAGIMVGTLTHTAELLGIGLCSIGSVNYQEMSTQFQLNKNQVLLHTIELGMKPVRANPVVSKEITWNDGEAGTYITEKKLPGQTSAQSLRLVLMSGDWIPLPLPEKIWRYFPQTEIVSLGGATEGSIWSIYYPIKKINNNWKSIPYGMPLANQKFYVLNYQGRLCPVGVPGELYIGGKGVASGYLNDVEKTQASFIEHPQLENLYRTGDYGVLHKDGYIDFLGRRDQQIKIKGYRIELGEIENCILKQPGIKETVCTVRQRKDGEKYLCAYFVPVSAGVKSSADFNSQLRIQLSRMLPDYMIPSYFIQLVKIPLTVNGKLNRKELPDPDEAKTLATLESQYAPPLTEIEKSIVNIFSEVVKQDKIGIHDNFFELGISSLEVAKISAKLKENFKIKFPLIKLYEFSTINSLAEYIGYVIDAQMENVNGKAGDDFKSTMDIPSRRIYNLDRGKNRMKMKRKNKHEGN